MAGTLIVDLAECLSGLVAAQLKREGAPYITGGVISNMDMATTQYCYGSPEFNILHAALTELIHYNNLPSFGTAGCTDAKVVDQQAAAEVALNILMAALSGANLIHDLGFMEAAISGSLDLIVLDDEIIGMVKRMMRGIDVNEETKALDIIKTVGPGGHFLGEEHTFKYFKSESWFPTLMNRQRYQQWSAEGSQTLGERLNQRVKQILAEHKPEPLPETVKAKIKDAVDAAEARVAKKA
jgi:trimethylamine--corrinoid protein Co-methyltransferase